MDAQRPLPILGAVVAAAAGLSACGSGSSGSSASAPATGASVPVATTPKTVATTPTATGSGPVGSPPPVRILRGTTTVRLSPAVRTVLGVAGVKTGAAAPAQRAGAGTIRLPIVPGTPDGAPTAPQLRHRGAVTFAAGGHTIQVTHLVLSPGTGEVTGVVAGRRVGVFGVDRAQPTRSGSHLRYRDLRLTLGADLAAALKQRLGTPTLPRGLSVGTASVDATTA